MIHVRLFNGLWNFQRHLSKLVDSHFTRFPRRLFFLWPTISPRTVRRSTRVRLFSIAGVSNERCGISQRCSAMNQIGFSASHPVEIIESRKVHWTRISPKGAFATQIKVDIEIAHGQLSQAAINGLPITAAGEIGFRHCPPMTAHLENRNDMISILFCFQIEDQRWKSDDTKCGRGKNSAFET